MGLVTYPGAAVIEVMVPSVCLSVNIHVVSCHLRCHTASLPDTTRTSQQVLHSLYHTLVPTDEQASTHTALRTPHPPGQGAGGTRPHLHPTPQSALGPTDTKASTHLALRTPHPPGQGAGGTRPLLHPLL